MIILDQLSYTMFEQRAMYYQYGLKTLYNEGVHFSHCYHPHGKPKTAVGHATFATGAPAKYHGIVDNSWVASDGTTITCDDGRQDAAVFHPYGGTYDTRKGPDHLQLDTICDQAALHSSRIVTMTIAGKSRAAIMFSGRHGYTFWVDYGTGGFTSSRVYNSHLPDWVNQFNARYKLALGDPIPWNPVYAPDHAAYQSPIATARAVATGKPQFNHTTHIPKTGESPYKDYVSSPQGQRRLITFAQYGLDHLLHNYPESHIFLCLSLSSLDYIGHYYGPESASYRDMLYHADKDMQELFDWIYARIPRDDMLVIFTSDHGGMPIPEQMHDSHMSFSQRVSASDFIRELNADIARTFGINNLIIEHKQPWIYFNAEVYHQLAHEKQRSIIKRIQHKLREKPYIIDAFAVDELRDMPTSSDREPYRLLQNQIFSSRVGHMIYLIRPYCNVTWYSSGTTHATPYDFDTHVPLIVYQPGVYHNSHVSDYVTTAQIAPTVARILGVPKPAGCYACELPL